jgi:cob(I)alamin adenosyltransferase
MLIVITGNGKGKTTSALGQALRAVGEGRRVIMYQFIKGPWRSGEDISARRLAPDFKLIKGGKGFVGILGDPYPRSVHVKAAEKTWREIKRAVTSGRYHLVIADELNVALSLKLLTLKDVLPFLKRYKDKLDIMVTGRGAPRALIAAADLVSEIKEIKHPFKKGILAQRGREY